jgi:hypothetical protein
VVMRNVTRNVQGVMRNVPSPHIGEDTGIRSEDYHTQRLQPVQCWRNCHLKLYYRKSVATTLINLFRDCVITSLCADRLTDLFE